jgi:hypothetical protein
MKLESVARTGTSVSVCRAPAMTEGGGYCLLNATAEAAWLRSELRTGCKFHSEYFALCCRSLAASVAGDGHPTPSQLGCVLQENRTAPLSYSVPRRYFCECWMVERFMSSQISNGGSKAGVGCTHMKGTEAALYGHGAQFGHARQHIKLFNPWKSLTSKSSTLQASLPPNFYQSPSRLHGDLRPVSEGGIWIQRHVLCAGQGAQHHIPNCLGMRASNTRAAGSSVA